MSNKYDVVKKYGHPVTTGGTDKSGKAYQKESYDRGAYKEDFTRTVSRSGTCVNKYQDKELKDD